MAIKKNISEVKAQLSSLLEKVKMGEEVIIGKAGYPIAKIVPFERKDRKRTPGLLLNQIEIKDDFDTLPEEFLENFE